MRGKGNNGEKVREIGVSITSTPSECTYVFRGGKYPSGVSYGIVQTSYHFSGPNILGIFST